MAVYKDKNGTWYVSVRYTNWKGEADRKLKRGFQTKKEAHVRYQVPRCSHLAEHHAEDA